MVVQEQRIQQLWNPTEARFGGFDGFDSSVCIGDQTQRFGSHHQQQVGAGLGNVSGTTSPLGLTLTKTPSFLELVESKISKKYNATRPDEFSKGYSNASSPDESSKSGSKRKPKNGDAEKLKASNISALRLRIGGYERVSKNDGDLVAKCYYAKRKLVWEMLDGGLKNKIEINWSEISAIRADFPENQPSVLEIQLSHLPSFQRETDPQPRKHTLWHVTPDFTGGQASMYRRHCIQFREGELEKHYEKLLQCDKRLLMLSQKPFPYLESPLFDNMNLSGNEEFGFEFSRHQPGYAPTMQYPQFDIRRHLPACFYQPTQMLQQSSRPMNAVHLNSSLPSYMMGRENQITEQPLHAYPNQADHAFPINGAHSIVSGVGIGGLFTNHLALRNLEDQLLNDQVAPVVADDQLSLKRKNSWFSLLDAAGGENNSVQISPNYKMMESRHEPSTDTNNSWNSEQSVGYDEFSFQDSGNWSTSPSPNSTLEHIQGLGHFNVNLKKANLMRKWS